MEKIKVSVTIGDRFLTMQLICVPKEINVSKKHRMTSYIGKSLDFDTAYVPVFYPDHIEIGLVGITRQFPSQTKLLHSLNIIDGYGKDTG